MWWIHWIFCCLLVYLEHACGQEPGFAACFEVNRSVSLYRPLIIPFDTRVFLLRQFPVTCACVLRPTGVTDRADVALLNSNITFTIPALSNSPCRDACVTVTSCRTGVCHNESFLAKTDVVWSERDAEYMRWEVYQRTTRLANNANNFYLIGEIIVTANTTGSWHLQCSSIPAKLPLPAAPPTTHSPPTTHTPPTAQPTANMAPGADVTSAHVATTLPTDTHSGTEGAGSREQMEGGSSSRNAVIIGVVLACCLLIGCLVATAIICLRRRKQFLAKQKSHHRQQTKKIEKAYRLRALISHSFSRISRGSRGLQSESQSQAQPESLSQQPGSEAGQVYANIRSTHDTQHSGQHTKSASHTQHNGHSTGPPHDTLPSVLHEEPSSPQSSFHGTVTDGTVTPNGVRPATIGAETGTYDDVIQMVENDLYQ